MRVAESDTNGTDLLSGDLQTCLAEIAEVSALRGRTLEVSRLAHANGLPWPDVGHARRSSGSIVLSVRPNRWLVLTAPTITAASACRWHKTFAPCAVAVDVSSAWTVLRLTGPALREVLMRNCRLALSSTSFQEGWAAATLFSNVALIVAWFDAEPILMTPSTTAQHFCECLARSVQAYRFSRGRGTR